MADRRYSIYADRSGRLALHCSGFSWLAALFPLLWAVPRRLWLACLGWLAAKVLFLAVLFHVPVVGQAAALGIYLAAILLESWAVGRLANPFHRWWLHRHGYVLIAAPSVGRSHGMSLECVSLVEPWDATTVMLLPLLGLVCALPLVPLLRRFYSRRMIALMSLHEVDALPGADMQMSPAPAPMRLPPDEPSLAQCLRQRQARLLRASVVAWLCTNAVALVMVTTGVFNGPTPSSYLFWLVLVCSPFLVNLQRQGTKLALLLVGAGAAVLQALFGADDVSAWLAAPSYFAIVLVFYLATAHRTLRTAVTFAGFVTIGAAFAVYVASLTTGLMTCVHLAPSAGAPPSAKMLTSYVQALAGAGVIALFTVLGFIPLLAIARSLRRGWLSETSAFVALALCFVFATVMSTSELALAPRLALLALWLAAVGVAYGAVLRASPWPRKARSLLVLRVFSKERRSEKVLDALQSRWQLAGPVVQIGGPDLMALNFGLGQFIHFITFRVDPLFQATANQARGLVRHLDASPDREGRFRLHEVFCTDSAWRVAVDRLLDGADAVLLDLCGFGEHREGTIYEVELLARRGRLARTVGVFDARTDWACFERHAAAAGPPQALAGRIDARSRRAVDTCFERLLTIADCAESPALSAPGSADSSATRLPW